MKALKQTLIRCFQGKLAELKAAKKVSTYFYDQPTTASRRNVYISQEVSKQRIYNMQSVFGASLPVSQQYIYPGKQPPNNRERGRALYSLSEQNWGKRRRSSRRYTSLVIWIVSRAEIWLVMPWSTSLLVCAQSPKHTWS